MHRQPWDIKQISVTKKPSGRWFANVVCEEARKSVPRIETSKSIGIDVGIKNFIYDSDGYSVSSPQFLKSILKPLRKAGKRVARRQVGSNNHNKAKNMRARLYERMYDRSIDFLHKVTTEYAKKYDLIFLERLAVANLKRNHKLARVTLDCGCGTFGNSTVQACDICLLCIHQHRMLKVP